MRNYRTDTAGDCYSGRVCRIIFTAALWALMGCSPLLPAAVADSGSEGRAALRSGNYAEAVKFFESALKEDMEPESIRLGLLQAMRFKGDYKEAADRFEAFISERPGSAPLHLEGARIFLATGEYAEAEDSMRRSLSLAIRPSEIWMAASRTLAELLEDTGRKSDALDLWDGIINEYLKGTIRDNRRLGTVAVAAWQRGYIEDARDIFLDASDANPEEVSLEALVDFGYLFLEKYNATDAMESFKDCLEINSSYPDALIGMAQAKKFGNNPEVEAYSRAALEVNPNLVSARNLLAELALEAEYYDAARTEINAALDINPVDLESLSLLGVCHFIRGDSAAFESTEKKILAINPAYGRLYHILAENLVRRRKYREAVDFSRKAIALNPELWSAYTTLGMNLTRLGDLEGGRRAMEQAFEGDPYNVWASNSLDVLDQMDTFTRSESDHFRFLISPEDSPVLAPYATRLAEEVYAKLTRRYDFQPGDPLSIEIFPDHGGFAVRTLGLPGLEGALGVCFGKVIAMDSPRTRKVGTFNWGTTLWHEFAHVITLQMTNHNIPRWFSEGLSVFEEHKARPGWGDDIDLTFIKAYKEGELLKASELNRGFTRPESPERIMVSYLQSALVCHWMEEKYGFESIKHSLRLFAENKPAEEVFLEALGLDAAAMDAEYARYIDERVSEMASRIVVNVQSRTAAKPDRDSLKNRLEDKPDDFFANLGLGQLLQSEGSPEEAEGYLKKARELFPYYVEEGNPYQLLAQSYIERQREDEALSQLEDWIRIDGNSREPLIMAAEIYEKREDWDSLVRILDLSIYLHPYDEGMQKKLGEAALKSEKWDQAIAAYQSLLALNSTDPAEAHLDLAAAFLASGDRNAAKRETRNSLEIAPSYRKAQKLLLEVIGDVAE